MKKLFLTILFAFVLNGVASADEINLECKFNNYVEFGTSGSYRTDNSKNPFLKDKFFKMNSNIKKLYKLDTVGNRWYLIKDVSWSNDVIKWKVEYDTSDKDIFFNEINRLNGRYKYSTNTNENSHFYKVLKIARQEWFYDCSKIEKKF